MKVQTSSEAALPLLYYHYDTTIVRKLNLLLDYWISFQHDLIIRQNGENTQSSTLTGKVHVLIV